MELKALFVEDTRGRQHADYVDQGKFKDLSDGALNAMHEGLATVDGFSKLLFKTAPPNVAFVGMYDLVTHTAYLHPLKPKWVDTDKKTYSYSNNSKFKWSAIKKADVPAGIKRKSFTHKAGKSPSHSQLANMYHGNDEDSVLLRLAKGELVGFSIVKRGEGSSHEFNAQSQTMNYSKFSYRDGIRPKANATRGEDSYITKEWSAALMALLSRELA